MKFLSIFFLIFVFIKSLYSEGKKEFEIYHIPPSIIKAGESLEINAIVENEENLKDIFFHYRIEGKENFKSHSFESLQENKFIFTLKPENIKPPAIEYYIEAISKDGEKKEVFGNAKKPYKVYYIEKETDLRYKERLSRYKGLQNRFNLTYYFHNFGEKKFVIDEKKEIEKLYPDYFTSLKIEYNYFILADYIYSINFGFKYWGHKMPGKNAYLEYAKEAEIIEEKMAPAFLCGYGSSEFELIKYLFIGAGLSLGASEKGFEAGFEAYFRVGNPTGTRMDIGFEVIRRLGYSVYFEFLWDTVPYFLMGMSSESTTFPYSAPSSSISYFKIMPLISKNINLEFAIGFGVREGFNKRGISFGGGAQFLF